MLYGAFYILLSFKDEESYSTDKDLYFKLKT